jgi:hypothetical protein
MDDEGRKMKTNQFLATLHQIDRKWRNANKRFNNNPVLFAAEKYRLSRLPVDYDELGFKPFPVGIIALEFDGKFYGVDTISWGYTDLNGEKLSPEAIEQLKAQLKERYGQKE